MKLKDAIEQENLQEIYRLILEARESLEMNNESIYRWAKNVSGISIYDWEELMFLVDDIK